MRFNLMICEVALQLRIRPREKRFSLRGESEVVVVKAIRRIIANHVA